MRHKLYLALLISLIIHGLLALTLWNKPKNERLPRPAKSKDLFFEVMEQKQNVQGTNLKGKKIKLKNLTKQILNNSKFSSIPYAEERAVEGNANLSFQKMDMKTSAKMNGDLELIFRKVNGQLNYHRQLSNNEMSGYVQVEFSVNKQGQLTRIFNYTAENEFLAGYTLFVLYRSLEKPLPGLSPSFNGLNLTCSFYFEILRTNNIKGDKQKFEVFKNALNFYRSVEKSSWAITATNRPALGNSDPAAGEVLVNFDWLRIFQGKVFSKKEEFKNRIHWDLLYLKRQMESRCITHNLPLACRQGAKLAKLFGEFDKAHRFKKMGGS